MSIHCGIAEAPRRAHRLFILVALTVGLLAFGAQAAWATVGFEGPSYRAACDPTKPSCVQSVFGNPTGTKPESKLWVHDGLWWAVMWDTVSGDYHIFWLDAATDKWNDSGTLVDGRRTSRQDVVSSGNSLYIASHRFSGASEAAGSQAVLHRYSYNATTRKYTLQATGTISNAQSETLVIDLDSTGRLWATWTQGPSAGPRDVKVATSAPASHGANWSAPMTIGTVPTDDISSVIAFGTKVGVMWNNSVFKFAVHNDGAPTNVWTIATAWAPAAGADDHINLKADAAGRVYAAVKTNQKSASHLRLLVRATNGTWTDHKISDLEGLSRPIVLLDGGTVRVFANGPDQQAGTIYQKSVSLATLLGSPTSEFDAGLPPFIEKGSGPTQLVDATSTKQVLGPSTGLVVLASEDDASKTYWHNNIGEPSAPPPGGGGNDTGPNVIRGTPGPDVIRGTNRRDIIIGLGGNDRLYGRRGNDTLRGKGGRDRLVGGPGKDLMLGGPGRDTFIAKDRTRDVLKGGPGRDRAHRDRRLDVIRSIEAFF